jgi:4-hydroxy-tetrahydrodipicolinate synthase
VPGRTGCNIDAATCAKLATIPRVIGVKEASGNITQMVEICRAVPQDFLVLSGDDALTLPLMAIGGKGLISVASNVIPAAMSNMVEAAERGDFAGARQMHHHVVPLMLGNFIESNPGPVKFAMATLGLCEEVYRLPMVSPRPASQEKILAFLKELKIERVPVGAGD